MEIPELNFTDPKATPSQIRGWAVVVAGQSFAVTIQSFDMDWPHGLFERELGSGLTT